MVLLEIINKGAITMDQSHSNTIEPSRKPGKHLTLDERGIIQALHHQGYSLLLSWAVRTQPYTTKFGVERPILKAIVGVDHSIQPSVDRKLMRNTENALGDL